MALSYNVVRLLIAAKNLYIFGKAAQVRWLTMNTKIDTSIKAAESIKSPVQRRLRELMPSTAGALQTSIV